MLNMEDFGSHGSLGIASYCDGDCCICKAGDSRNCIANTYSFEVATKEQIIDRLNNGRFADYRELQRSIELTRMQLAEDRARDEKARIYEEAKALYGSAVKKKRWHKPLTKEENDAVIYIQALNKHQDDIAAMYERRCAEIKNINYSDYDVDINLDTGLQMAWFIGLTALDFVLDSVVLSAKIRTGNAILNKFF